MTRVRSRANPARPYICLLIILIFVDGALDLGGAAGQGEAVGNGLLVVADAGGEGAQAGMAVAGSGGGEPGFQVAVAGPPSHHLGEAGNVPGQGAGVRAAGADGVELCLFSWLKMVRAGEQPAGDLPGLGRRRGGIGCGGAAVSTGPAGPVPAGRIPPGPVPSGFLRDMARASGRPCRWSLPSGWQGAEPQWPMWLRISYRNPAGWLPGLQAKSVRSVIQDEYR